MASFNKIFKNFPRSGLTRRERLSILVNARFEAEHLNQRPEPRQCNSLTKI
jgi:hypothetical protein